jgi:hypothetical protein
VVIGLGDPSPSSTGASTPCSAPSGRLSVTLFPFVLDRFSRGRDAQAVVSDVDLAVAA